MEGPTQRCWEFMRCNAEGSCPSYPEGGEECWRFAGTKRHMGAPIKAEETQKKVKTDTRDVQDMPLYRKVCKFVIRYGMCQCCPFYQYIEKINRAKKFSSGSHF